MSLFNKPIEFFAIKFINSQIEKFGEMVNLKIDSKNKNIEMEVLLKGEKETIFINIEKYEIVTKDGLNFITFKDVTVSREWIEALIQNFVIPRVAPNNMIEIDHSYAKFIDLLV